MIKMPPSIYLRKKKRANEILEDAYSVAKRLGYLVDYDRTGHLDTLTLNDKKYANNRLSYNFPDILDEKSDKDPSAAKSLGDFFHSQRRKLDTFHKSPEGKTREDQVLIFQALLASRPLEDIERLICWSTTKKYSRISSTLKLSQNFSEAWTEMMISLEFSAQELK